MLESGRKKLDDRISEAGGIQQIADSDIYHLTLDTWYLTPVS